MAITITYPANGAVVSGTIKLTASAPGTKRINWQIDGHTVSSDMAAPFEYVWDTTQNANDTHQIKAIAGNGKSSASITVTVSNVASTGPTGPPPPSQYRLNGPLGTRVPLPNPGTCGLSMQTGGIGWWPKDSRPLWLQRAAAAGLPAFAGYGAHYDGSGGQIWQGVATCEDPYFIANMSGGDGLTHEQFAINHNAQCTIAWQPGYTLVDMNNGAADAAWKLYANYWKQYAPHIIMWRPFVEFNLPNPYGVVPGGVISPGNVALFRSVWQRMVTTVASIADNVGFIYNMDEGNHRDYVNSCYPGDAYIDMVGTDIYNWCVAGSAGQCWSAPFAAGGPATPGDLYNYSRGVGMTSGDGSLLWSMYDIFGSGLANRSQMYSVPGYGIPADLPTKKPFMVCETGCAWHSDADTAFKAAWWPKALSETYGLKHMKNLAWFSPYDAQVDYYPNWNHQYPTTSTYPGPNNGSPTGDNNWMVDYPNTHPEIGAAFTAFAADPYMRGR